MNEKQKKAANKALARFRNKEIVKKLALSGRENCIRDLHFYDLPYRVLYDLKYNLEADTCQPNGQIPLSKFYPYRAHSAQVCKEIDIEVKHRTLTDEEFEELKYSEFTPKDKRSYYFTCFLDGFNLESFKNWDWTGNPISEKEELQLKHYYLERQASYRNNPEKYAPPALKKNDDLNRYSKIDQELFEIQDHFFD